MTRQRLLSVATKIFAGSFVLLIIGFIIPQEIKMPVKGATRKSYSQNSFWAYPWGKSITHKGVDIFGKEELMFTRLQLELFYIKAKLQEAVT